MKGITIISISFIFVLIFSSFPSVSSDENQTEDFISSANYGKGYRYNIQGWIYLHIEGGAYERGYQHGYLMAEEIVDMITRWKFVYPQKNSWSLQKKDIVRLFWNKYPEEYQQEIRGIADGVADREGKIDGNLVCYKDILALNEMYEYSSRHKSLFTRPIISYTKEFFNLLKPTALEDEHAGKCSAFIATGDATADGRIVASHMTKGHYRDNSWWQYYVTERWNVILDIKPTKGHRMMIASAPGLIWSDEDYYQNDAGLILMETTLPTGKWRRSGTPVVVRARKAIQYSDSIDDMVSILLENNNGLMANDWVMGDTKTGEIASFELALRNHAITRTKNGFLWSCNNPKDDKVRWELNSPFGFGIIGRIISKNFKPRPRDKKFEELKNEFYGKIDVSIAKKIMSTYPINKSMFDCKITDSELVNDFGMWVYYGYVNGSDNVLVDRYRSFSGITDMPSCGWVNIYGMDEKIDFRPPSKAMKNKDNKDLIWSFETYKDEYGNAIYSNPEIDDNSLYFTSWNGNVYSLDLNGDKNWDKKIGWSCVSSPTIIDEMVFVGSSDGFFALNKYSGDIIWDKNIGPISSKPMVYKNMVYCGSNNGYVYALDLEGGELIWKYQTNDDIYSSPIVDKGVLYIGSNDNNFYALDAKTGEKLWKFETDAPVTSNSCIYRDLVIFGSNDHNLYALEKENGDIRWKFTTGWGVTSSPVASKDTMFFGSLDNNLYAINPSDGSLKWYFTANAAIQSTPEVYGGYVFFGCDDGKFYALNESNGNIFWIATPDYSIDGIHSYLTKPIISSPLAFNGEIFFGSTNGKMYSYNAWTYEQPEQSKSKTEKDEGFIAIVILIIFILLIVLIATRKINNRKRF